MAQRLQLTVGWFPLPRGWSTISEQEGRGKLLTSRQLGSQERGYVRRQRMRGSLPERAAIDLLPPTRFHPQVSRASQQCHPTTNLPMGDSLIGSEPSWSNHWKVVRSSCEGPGLSYRENVILRIASTAIIFIIFIREAGAICERPSRSASLSVDIPS